MRRPRRGHRRSPSSRPFAADDGSNLSEAAMDGPISSGGDTRSPERRMVHSGYNSPPYCSRSPEPNSPAASPGALRGGVRPVQLLADDIGVPAVVGDLTEDVQDQETRGPPHAARYPRVGRRGNRGVQIVHRAYELGGVRGDALPFGE